MNNDKFNSEEYLFFHSVKTGSLSITKSLLNKGIDCNATNKNKESAIHIATKNNNIDMVKLLHSYEVNINAKNANGLTPLMISAINNSEDLFKFLLSIDKIDISLVSECKTVEDYAKESGNTRILTILYQHLYKIQNPIDEIETPVQRRHSAFTSTILPKSMSKPISQPTNKSKSSLNVLNDMKSASLINTSTSNNQFLNQMSHFEEKLERLRKEIMNTSSISKTETSFLNDDSINKNMSKSLKIQNDVLVSINSNSNNNLFYNTQPLKDLSSAIDKGISKQNEYNDQHNSRYSLNRKNTYNDFLIKSQVVNSLNYLNNHTEENNNSIHQENSIYTSKFGLKDPYTFTIGSNVHSIRKTNEDKLKYNQVNEITNYEQTNEAIYQKPELTNSPYHKYNSIRRNTTGNIPNTVTNYKFNNTQNNINLDNYQSNTTKEQENNSIYLQHRTSFSQINSKLTSNKNNLIINDSKLTVLSSINDKTPNSNIVLTLRNTENEISAKGNLDSYNLPLQVSSRNKKEHMFNISQRKEKTQIQSNFQSPSPADILNFCNSKESKMKSKGFDTTNISQNTFNIKTIREYFVETEKALIIFPSYSNNIIMNSKCSSNHSNSSKDDNTRIYKNDKVNNNFNLYYDNINNSNSHSRIEAEVDNNMSESHKENNSFELKPRPKAKPINKKKHEEENEFEIKKEELIATPAKLNEKTLEDGFNSELTSISVKIDTNNDLYILLLNISLDHYFKNFIQTGYDDLKLLLEQITIEPLNHQDLKKVGIKKVGDRLRIMLKLEKANNSFDFSLPLNTFYNNNSFDLFDPFSKQLENWLSTLKMESYLKNFINQGIFTLDLLFIQSVSPSPLTDEILEKEIKIEKVGYRARILNKIKQDTKLYLERIKSQSTKFNKKEEDDSCKCFIF